MIHDFRTHSKFEIGLRYVFPFALIIFGWASLGSLYMTTLKQTDLISIKGFATNISYEKHKNGSDLIIVIDDCNYRLLNHGYNLDNIASKILNERYVELLIRTPTQYLLSLGKPNDIMQIKQNDNLLVSFESMQRHYKVMSLFTGLISVMLIIVLIIFRKR
jgi:hypothetical protein